MTEEQLFHQALEHANPSERAAFLDQACAGQPELRKTVEALLAAHAASGDLLETSAYEVASAPQPPPTVPLSGAQPGQLIAGRYELIEILGAGGMGEVWVAKQSDPVKRRVALKLIKPGMDSKAVIQRFNQERQALALMDHPNIAKVLDGGMTGDGRPFFVMELVNGLPLTTFCDKSKLPPRERLELFVPICQAVQHAHHKGIIHRDLKPGNILVTMIDGKPVPKVIDFGVAKAIGDKLTEDSFSTGFGAVVGTLEYMSPEQAGFSGQDVDTRADIYSLGVILYELLTGLRPIDSKRLRKAALTEMIRIIQEEEPSKPSTRLSTDASLPSLAALRQMEPRKLMALLRGELDWVVMKCLEKQRDQRYETANGLARDVQRYLADEAVEARPVSFGYRARKFLKRNKGPVLAAALVGLSVLVGLIGTTWGLITATSARAEEARQRTEAQNQAARAEEQMRVTQAVNDFLTQDLLGQSLPENQGVVTARLGRNSPIGAIVDRGAGRVTTKFSQLPAIEVELQFVLGEVYLLLGDLEMAQRCLERAQQIVTTLPGPQELRLAKIQALLGVVFMERRKLSQAEPLFQAALATRIRLLGNEDPATIRMIACLGMLRQYQQRLEEAEQLHLQAYTIRARTLGEFHPETLHSISNLGWLHSDKGNDVAAAERFAEALAKGIQHHGHDHPLAVVGRHNLASTYRRMGRLSEALALAQENLEICMRIYGERHQHTLYCLAETAQILDALGKFAEAEQHYQRTLELRRAVLGTDHPETLISMSDWASLLNRKGEHVTAVELLKTAWSGLVQVYGDEHEATNSALNNLAFAHRQLGQNAEAIQLFTRALLYDERTYGGDHPKTTLVRLNLAETCVAMQRYSEAEDHFRKVLSSQRKTLPADDFNLAYTLFLFGLLQKEQGKFREAEALLRECLTIGHTRAPNDWRPFNTRRHLAEVLLELKRYDEAEGLLLEAYRGLSERISAIPAPLRRSRTDARLLLIKLYGATGNVQEATKWASVEDESKPASPPPPTERK